MAIATLLMVFLLTDLSGSAEHHIMSKISVPKGQTIVIPCLYDANFVHFKKYLSYGPYFISSHVRHKLSIRDYKTENFFTAILRNADLDDTGSYWCAIELSGPDPATRLCLEVTEGKTKPYVLSQNVTGHDGKNVIIHCYGASKWCKIGGSCAEEKSGTFDKSKLDLRGDDKVLNVTLKSLHKNDSGWYFCSDGKSQMPVYVTMSSYLNDTRVHLKKSRDHKQSIQIVVLGPMGLLFIIICGVVICLIFRKRKQRTPASDVYENMKHMPQKRYHAETQENTYEVMSKGYCVEQTVKDD